MIRHVAQQHARHVHQRVVTRFVQQADAPACFVARKHTVWVFFQRNLDVFGVVGADRVPNRRVMRLVGVLRMRRRSFVVMIFLHVCIVRFVIRWFSLRAMRMMMMVVLVAVVVASFGERLFLLVLSLPDVLAVLHRLQRTRQPRRVPLDAPAAARRFLIHAHLVLGLKES